MKMYREEMTLQEWNKALDEHSKRVTVSKEEAIKDLQAAGILDKKGKLAPQFNKKG